MSRCSAVADRGPSSRPSVTRSSTSARQGCRRRRAGWVLHEPGCPCCLQSRSSRTAVRPPGRSRGRWSASPLAGFRSEPSSVKSLERSSRRRFHASVRGRHLGRHIMPSEGSRRANLRERGSSPTAGPPACYRLHRLPRPGDGTSAGRDEPSCPRTACLPWHSVPWLSLDDVWVRPVRTPLPPSL